MLCEFEFSFINQYFSFFGGPLLKLRRAFQEYFWGKLTIICCFIISCWGLNLELFLIHMAFHFFKSEFR